MKKKLVILTLIIALAVPAAFAFKGGPRDRGISEPPIELLAKILDMSEEQKKQFKTVMTEQKEKRDEYRDGMRENRQKVREEMNTKMTALHTETLEKLKTFLDADQIKILTEMHEQRKTKHEARTKGKR